VILMPVNASTELILGTAQLVTSYGVTRSSDSPPDQISARELLQVSFNSGVATLDTAPAYGEAEAFIGNCGIPFKIHTKLRKGTSAVDSLKESKKNLRVDEIDVVYIHDIDAFRSNPQQIVNDLSKILDLGVRDIGVSIYDEEDLALVRQFDQVTFVQVPMNILDRRFSGSKIDEIRSSGLSIIVRSAFLQGVLLADPTSFRPQVRHLQKFVAQFQEIVSKIGLNPIEACLYWLMAQNEISGIIVGAQNATEFIDIKNSWEAARSRELDPDWADSIILPDANSVDPRKWKAS
jgi:aryl-alcohol dehydrogenase-like predicted oxidoreductase